MTEIKCILKCKKSINGVCIEKEINIINGGFGQHLCGMFVDSRKIKILKQGRHEA